MIAIANGESLLRDVEDWMESDADANSDGNGNFVALPQQTFRIMVSLPRPTWPCVPCSVVLFPAAQPHVGRWLTGRYAQHHQLPVPMVPSAGTRPQALHRVQQAQSQHLGLPHPMQHAGVFLTVASQSVDETCVRQGARLVVRARYACLDNFTTLDVCIQQRLAVSVTVPSYKEQLCFRT